MRVTGAVAVGDLLISNGDTTARAVRPGAATVGERLAKLAIAQESNPSVSIKLVKASVGTVSDTMASTLQSDSDSYQNLTVSGSASIKSLTVAENAVIEGRLTVAVLTVGTITVNGHIITGGGAPTAIAQLAAGSNATVSTSGTDTAGTITFTTGAAPAAGELIKLSFDKAYDAAPRIILSPSNAASSDLRYFKGVTDTKEFMLNSKNMPTANTTYIFDYFIAQ